MPSLFLIQHRQSDVKKQQPFSLEKKFLNKRNIIVLKLYSYYFDSVNYYFKIQLNIQRTVFSV